MKPRDFAAAIINELKKQNKEGLRLLTVNEVAYMLSISPQHLTRNLMHEPNFPTPVRFGQKGALRFYKHEIEKYILNLKGPGD